MAPTVALISPCDPQLEKLLRELRYKHVTLTASRLLSLASQPAGAPGVVIADVRDRPELIAELGAIKRRHPVGAPIIIVAPLDPHLMLEAMRAGITECVTEPVDAQQVDAAIKRVTTVVAPATKGEVFAFLGAKGGVGTTTLAVNVATVLASAGGRVLFSDLNIAYGDAAVYFGVEPRFSLVDALENTARLDDTFLKSLVASTSVKVDILASADRDPGRPVDFRGLGRLIEVASGLYRYVVLDVPRGGRAVVDPLEKADAIVVVSNHELAAVRSASRLASILRERYGSKRVSVVISRFDAKAEITNKDIQQAVGDPIRHTFPSDYRVALQALNRGRPLVLDNHTKLASSIQSFTRDLARLDSHHNTDAEVAPRGLLGRLAGNRH